MIVVPSRRRSVTLLSVPESTPQLERGTTGCGIGAEPTETPSIRGVNSTAKVREPFTVKVAISLRTAVSLIWFCGTDAPGTCVAAATLNRASSLLTIRAKRRLPD